MIQIILVTHGGLCREMINTAQIIVGTQPDLVAVSLELHEGNEDLKRKLLPYLLPKEQDPIGSLALVDMFGGTPSNVSLELSRNYFLRVVTGVNLPILLEALMHRATLDLQTLAELVTQKGRQSIMNANDLLSGENDRKG